MDGLLPLFIAMRIRETRGSSVCSYKVPTAKTQCTQPCRAAMLPTSVRLEMTRAAGHGTAEAGKSRQKPQTNEMGRETPRGEYALLTSFIDLGL
jgi:hypothetical protein